jgi:hypothetical protein
MTDICKICGDDHLPEQADQIHKELIATLRAKTKVMITDDHVTAIHSSVIGFYHTITPAQVVLKCDPKKPEWNALRQMHERIREGLKALFT